MSNTSNESSCPITEPRQWLEANAALVTQAVRSVSRRHRLRRQDADDLLSQTFSHLLKDDCRVLRAFRGVGSHAAYVAVVAERNLKDLRTAQWGKWRPSAAARRGGASAIRFEQLVHRDGMDPSHARVVTGYTGEVAPPRTSGRSSRRVLGLDTVLRQPWAGPDPLEQLMQQQRQEAGARLRHQLRSALDTLEPKDVTILRLRHGAGLPMAQIARRLSIDQRAIYPRVVSLHKKLRRLIAQTSAEGMA